MPPSKGVDDESSSIPKFIGVSTQSVAVPRWRDPNGGIAR